MRDIGMRDRGLEGWKDRQMRDEGIEGMEGWKDEGMDRQREKR